MIQDTELLHLPGRKRRRVASGDRGRFGARHVRHRGHSCCGFPLSAAPLQRVRPRTYSWRNTTRRAQLCCSPLLGGTGAHSPVGAGGGCSNRHLCGRHHNLHQFPNQRVLLSGDAERAGNSHAFVTQLHQHRQCVNLLLGLPDLPVRRQDRHRDRNDARRRGLRVRDRNHRLDQFPAGACGWNIPVDAARHECLLHQQGRAQRHEHEQPEFLDLFRRWFPDERNRNVSGGAIAVDNNANVSNIYFTGRHQLRLQAAPTDFPIRNAYQSCLDTAPTPGTPQNFTNVTLPDTFIAKLIPGTTTGAQLLLYCTYLGGGTTWAWASGWMLQGMLTLPDQQIADLPGRHETNGKTIIGPQQPAGGTHVRLYHPGRTIPATSGSNGSTMCSSLTTASTLTIRDRRGTRLRSTTFRVRRW